MITFELSMFAVINFVRGFTYGRSVSRIRLIFILRGDQMILDPPPWNDFPNDMYIDGHNIFELMYILKSNKMTHSDAYDLALEKHREYKITPSSLQIITRNIERLEMEKRLISQKKKPLLPDSTSLLQS